MTIPVPVDTLYLPIEAPKPTATAVIPDAIEVVVRPGDNMWILAEQRLRELKGGHITDADTTPYWLAVIAANRNRVRSGDPDLIFPGEILILPAWRLGVVAEEDLGDGTLGEDGVKRLGDDRGDRKDFDLVEPRASSDTGKVFVTMTSSTDEFLMRSTAGSDRMAWVAAIRTDSAPCSRTSSAALVTVPAVSIMSSTMMAWRPPTSPDTSRAAETLWWSGSRRL